MARVGVIAGFPWSITRWTHSLAGGGVSRKWFSRFGFSHMGVLTAGGGFHVAASWASSGASWLRTSDQAGDCCAGAHGKNVKVHRRCTDARPGSKPRTTHPVHLWLIKCTEAGPGWSPVPARLGLCGTPLRTSLRHACDSFPARFQLVSSSFPARFQLVSSSVLSSVAFPVGNR